MPRSHGFTVCLFASAGLLCAEVPAGWPDSYPHWWYDAADPANGVIDATRPVLNQGNDAPLVLGQLKHFASEARDELNAKLPNGAGAEIDTLVNGFITVDPSNLSAANLGQLKAVAAPFYTRFAQEGFVPGSPGWPVGMELIDTSGVTDNSPNYPWLDDVTPSNAAIANIGQAKHLFSWDLSLWSPENGGYRMILSPDPNAETVYQGTQISFSIGGNVSDLVTYEWDFDYYDDNYMPDATSQSGVYVYSVPGDYTIYLIVEDTDGNWYEFERDVSIAAMPRAQITSIPAPLTEPGRNITLHAESSTGSITSYQWDFGDGTPIVSGADLEHRYLRHAYGASGSYVVTLTVYYDETSPIPQSSDTLTITVEGFVDSDGDEIPDWWENLYGLDTNDPTDAAGNADADSLSNLQEYLQGSNPVDDDTDSDDWGDGQELSWGWDASYDQSREDGRYSRYGDFDGDGISNWVEAINDMNPSISRHDAIRNFRSVDNADGTTTYSWISDAADGDWFKIERKQSDGSWGSIYQTTYGSAELPYVPGQNTYNLTINTIP